MVSKFPPPANLRRAHSHTTFVGIPSRSVTDAVSVSPPDSVPEIVTVPFSSRLTTVTVIAMLSSALRSVFPAASLPSLTLTLQVTLRTRCPGLDLAGSNQS